MQTAISRNFKKAGVNWLGLGIENPNNEHRRVIHKDGFKEISVLNQIKQIREAGINVGGNYIFGLPFDNISSMRGTLEFALENPHGNGKLLLCHGLSVVRFTLRRSVKGMNCQKVMLDIVSTLMKH